MNVAKSSALEVQHLHEMQDELQNKLQESRRQDLGRFDSLHSSISALVVSQAYKRAEEELVAYVELKSSFPQFQARSERYVHHCCELIRAIDTKRNFQGLGALSLSKQTEIHEKIMEHFEELKRTLRLIEGIEREQRMTDVRSTVWVIQAVCYSIGLVVCAAIFLDARAGYFDSFLSVTNSLYDIVTSWLVNFINR